MALFNRLRPGVTRSKWSLRRTLFEPKRSHEKATQAVIISMFRGTKHKKTVFVCSRSQYTRELFHWPTCTTPPRLPHATHGSKACCVRERSKCQYIHPKSSPAHTHGRCRSRFGATRPKTEAVSYRTSIFRSFECRLPPVSRALGPLPSSHHHHGWIQPSMRGLHKRSLNHKNQ